MRVHIIRKPGTIMSEVYLVSGEGSQFGEYLTVSNGEVVATTFQYTGSDQDIKPAFLVPEMVLRDIISAFVEHARDHGFRNASESHDKGRLIATEKHLEDMRTLVFKQ